MFQRIMRRATHTLASLLPTIALLVAVLAAIPLIIAFLGYDAGAGLRAIWNGSFGSFYSLTSGTLVRSTPLLLTGLSVALAFRAGIFNIGAEGQLLVGAAAAALVGLTLGRSAGALALVPELLAGVLAGALWAGIAAVLRARFRVLEVISTILLNFVALYLVGYLVRGPMQEPLHIYPQSQSLAPAARLPRILPGSRLHAGFLIAVVVCIGFWWFMRFTAEGFRWRVVGANPAAARSAGQIDDERTMMRAFLVSGALAGLAGAIELTGVTYALYENLSPGYGYTGIAVALLARLQPAAVLPSALLFGGLEAGATAMQRDAGIPSAVAAVIEAVIILVAIAVWSAPVRPTLRRTPDAPDESSPASPEQV